MISTKLNHQFNYYLTGLLAFFTPIHPKILPIFIILITLNWIINPSNIRLSLKNLRSNYSLLAIVFLYFLYLVGMLYSTNLSFGSKVLETKMSLLILPLIYSAYVSNTKEKLEYYLKFFVYGCITYTVICFGYASYAYLKPVQTILYGVSYDLGANYFYYTYLSLFFHPSYTAMYSVFALLIISIGIKKGIVKMNWKVIISIISLVIFILFLSSKSGWITLILLCLLVLKWLISSKKVVQILYLITPILIGFFLLNVYFTPNFSHRLPKIENIIKAFTGKDQNNNEVTTGSDGNAARILIWKTSYELFTENFIVGQGTGDAKDNLLKKYEEKKMTVEYKQKLNSHNQFLSTAIAIGVTGLIALFFGLFFPLWISIKQQNYILSGFLILLIINLLFESMFENQAGLVFYATFNTLLCSTFVKNKQ